MTTGTPYIGSKISLISKAEIRYEGILYDVNSKEATVTLSKVRSYGTEDRPAPKPIQPRNEVYEYIIFRGSDIKDLSVNEMAKQDEGPQDPAIVSTQTLPPPTSRQQPPPPQGPTTGSMATGQPTGLPPGPTSGYTPFPPGLGTYNPFISYFARPPMMMGQPPLIPGTQHPHHHPPPPQHISSSKPPPPLTQSDPTPPKPSQPSALSSAGPPSESTPPVVTGVCLETSTPINSDGPSLPLPSSVSSLEQSEKKLVTNDLTSSASNEPSEHERLSERQTLFNNEETELHPPPDTTTNETNSKSRSKPTNQKGHSSLSPSYRNRRTPQYNTYQSAPPRGSRGNYRREGRGGSTTSSYNRPSRGVSGNYPTSNGRGQGTSGTTHQQPLRYDSEFDFDSANARFSKEQLEDEIKKKLKISDERSSADSTPDDTPPQERPEEEIEEGEYREEDDIPEEVVTEEHSIECYDRSKSFFDNISCEANSSSNRRPNRSEERALNTETFGVTSRGYRGRPRGGRGNRGRGYYPRGGNDWGYYDNYRYGGYQSRGRNYSGRGGGGYYSSGSGYYGSGSYKGRGGGYQDRRTYPRNQQSDYQS